MRQHDARLASPARPVLLGGSLLLAGALAGCGPFLSESGPGRGSVLTQAAPAPPPPAQRLSYRLIRVNAATLPALDAPPMAVPPLAAASAGQRFDRLETAGSAEGAIGVGDEVGVTIFEAAPGGLFITDHPENASGNSITLPPQQVDGSGMIVVPYGGAIAAAGRTPARVAREIERRLGPRALKPQVLVSVLDHRSGLVNVFGDAAGTARFALDPGGETVLGAIARAGGVRFPDYEVVVTLHRHGATQSERLSDIVAHPQQDIPLEAGDTLYLAHRPDFFLALGATGQASSLGPIDRRIAFGSERITLADALAKAGGLEDDRANSEACFVYRLDHLRTARGWTTVPTVYLTDLRDPAGYFYASAFQMRPEDVIFVSNAPATDLAKFLSLILPLAYSASNFNGGLK